MVSSASPIWHPFTQHGLQPVMTKIVGAEGAWLQGADGSRIFDGISSWWVITHGHNHPRITAAIRAQAGLLDQVIFAGFTHEPAEDHVVEEVFARQVHGRERLAGRR